MGGEGAWREMRPKHSLIKINLHCDEKTKHTFGNSDGDLLMKTK